MRTIAILLTVIIFGCAQEKKPNCNYISDYYPTMYKADLEFEKENYEKAYELYRNAFSSCKAKNTFGINEIGKFTETSAILKKFDITYEYAKEEILNGVELNEFEYNDNFREFLTSDYGKKFIAEYNELRKEYLNNADLKLRDELIAMRNADQIYRTSTDPIGIKKRDSIDKMHEKRLIDIFETIGYPTDRMVGPHTRNYPVDIQLLLLHTKDSIRMNYFVPKVKEFVKDGSAPPQNVGTMIDQYHLYNGKPQIYGTYKSRDGGYADMIEDIKKVDSNRLSIGLPTLKMKEKKDSLIKIKYGL